MRWVMAAAAFLAGSAPAYAANTEMGKIGGNFVVVAVVVLLLVGLVRRVPILNEQVRRARAGRTLRFVVGTPLIWLALAFVHAETGIPSSGWVAFPLWFGLTALFVMLGDLLVPAPLRRLWGSLFPGSPHRLLKIAR